MSDSLRNLATAINQRATEIYECGDRGDEAAALADAKDLVRGLSRILLGESLRSALGSPGDWGYHTPIGKALAGLYQEKGADPLHNSASSTALIEAVTAALPILITDRESTVDCATLELPDGTPDLSTLEEGTKPFVDEYDKAIALCEDALVKAGLR